MSLTPLDRVLLTRRLRRRSRRGPAVVGLFAIVLAAVVLTPLAALTMAVAGTGAAYAMLAGDLEQGIERIDDLDQRQMLQTTSIYDRNGVLLREVFVEGRRTYMPLSQIPDHVRQATIAVEDKTFYENLGVEATGIFRAVRGELTGQPGLGGGSTITQQFVRHVAFSYEERISRSYARKAKEIVLALILTRRQDKDQILEWYLNEIYYGNLAYGIEAAAQTVFGKSVAHIDLAEAAVLAGLPQLPGELDPLNPDPDVQRRVRNRQRVVLNLMAANDYITQAAADAAASAELVYNDPDDDLFLAPHFVVYVQDLLEERLDPQLLAVGGLEVTTSLDMSLQQLAEEVVRDQVDRLREAHDLTNGALVALEPRSGQVLAMVGSADYWDNEIDGRVNVSLRPRQPGSSIKPITYVTALERGMLTSSLIWDTPMELFIPEKYEPQNYDEEFHGPVRLRAALANSYNIPALKLLNTIPRVGASEEPEEFDAYMQDLQPNYANHDLNAEPLLYLSGVEQTIATAHRMGITGLNGDPWDYGLSLTLGGGEVTLMDLTTAYGTLANQGGRVRPNPILRITDSTGKVLYDLMDDRDALEPYLAVDPRVAYIVTDILADGKARAPAFGSTSPLSVGVPAAAKTGTTNDYRDNWTLGFTPYLTVGVWAGNSDNSEMRNSSGVTGAAPIWNAFMRNVAADPERRATVQRAREDMGFPFTTNFVRPAGVVERDVCRLESLRVPAAACQEYETELFVEDDVPDDLPASDNPAIAPLVGEGIDVWKTVPAAVIPMPPPPPELVAQAEAQNKPLRWPSVMLCQPIDGGPGMERAQPVAVIPLPKDAEERGFVIAWAQKNGWAALEPFEPCTPEMAAAALPPGSLPGLGDLVIEGFSYPQIAFADYKVNLAQDTVLSSRTVLTGTVQYNPSEIEYFKVELGAGSVPREWITLGDIHTDQVVDGPLETLDASSLPNGEYVVRLVLVKKDGNFLDPPHAVRIRIEH